MVTVSYPGVYVKEVPSGVRTITGVSTSIAMFIGRTGHGPLDTPIRCLNYTTFKDTFSEDVSFGDMARYVRLFFLNGGTDCYVMRIANGARAAAVTLQNESGQEVLHLEAKQPGIWGESIRAEVTYNRLHPEVTFDIRLFRWALDHRDNPVQADEEEFHNLSMDPNSTSYAVDVLTDQSGLVEASEPDPAPAAAINGYSLSGRPIEYSTSGTDEENAESLLAAWDLIVVAEVACRFEISVDGSAYAQVDLSHVMRPMGSANLAAAQSDLAREIQRIIVHEALPRVGASGTDVTVVFEDGPTPPEADSASCLLRISSANNGDVLIRRASTADVATRLMLGTEQGGLEVGAHVRRRPAPNGIGFSVVDPADGESGLADLAGVTQTANFEFTIGTHGPLIVDLQTITVPGYPFYRDAITPSATENSDGVREKLGLIRDRINEHRESNLDTFHWRAELWGHRLALLPTDGTDNTTATLAVTGGVPSGVSLFHNVRRYTVGVDGTAGYQTPAALRGSDGDRPTAPDYDSAYEIVEREVDLFNLLVLPPDRTPAQPMSQLWALASSFCQRQRAFLLMDPPTDWDSAQAATDGVADLRLGLENDYSAVFYPRLWMREGRREVLVGPAGAMAGLMARIDNSRGVWKAPAGIEANLIGVSGVQYRFSDRENGILNPRAINTIRVFPNGIVNWGARTLDGDDDFGSEWKYIPIRRLALFMEESLYRGIKWVVFEPNDEPLWSQIRLNVGAFMRNLYRQGAFQGKSPKEAYFVKCDAETTTQNDRNLGIVNIWVGFAPLKPAEFVILYLQQMAGQIEV